MRVRSVTIALLASASLPLSVAAQDLDFEIPPTVSAADILPEDLLRSEHHEVDDAVHSDGYLNYYVIRSAFGDFEVASNLMLRERVDEIEALAILDETSQTAVFIKAAADAGIGQIKTITSFATRPIQTVTGIPAGIGRMFTRYRRQAEEGVEVAKDILDGDDDEDYADNGGDDDDNPVDAVAGTATAAAGAYLNVSSAERAWHRELGTDPYTSNEVLQEAIGSVAWADRLGRFGIKQVGIPKIPGVDIVADVNDAVWSKDPYELRDYNQGILRAAGADEDLIEQFFDNRAMSPTLQTFLIAALAEMEATTGRHNVIRGALILETETEARFYVESAIMLAWHHRNKEPITRIDEGTNLPIGVKPDGSTVTMFAADHLYWNETVAESADLFLAARDNDEPVAHEVWLSGSASERTLREAAALGWDIHQNLAIMARSDPHEDPSEN